MTFSYNQRNQSHFLYFFSSDGLRTFLLKCEHQGGYASDTSDVGARRVSSLGNGGGKTTNQPSVSTLAAIHHYHETSVSLMSLPIKRAIHTHKTTAIFP